MLVGPYVQPESYQCSPPICSPPISNEEAARQMQENGRGYHRDMFAFFPPDGVYHRPLLFNAICNQQDLTDDIGPLHAVPGLHMRVMPLPTRPESLLPENNLVYPKAGDVVMFHCGTFGVDDLLLSRANSGPRLLDGEWWKEWVADDEEALGTP